MIAANGMLLLHQILHGEGRGEGDRFLEAAVRIMMETVELSLDRKKERLRFGAGEMVEGNEEREEEGERSKGVFDAVLRNATANANQDALRRHSDHGLVYADYYFIEFGNKLLRMGLI